MSWSVERSCSSLANPRNVISQQGVDSSTVTRVHHLSPTSTFFCTLYVCATCQPHGLCLRDVPPVRTSPQRSALHDFHDPNAMFPNLQTPETRYHVGSVQRFSRGQDPMAWIFFPTLHDSGLGATKNLACPPNSRTPNS
jgi:hypothetical protein